MADQKSNDEEEKEIIYYSGDYGGLTQESYLWDDFEEIGEKEFLKLKIFKIRIFLGKYNKKDCISGINVTFINIFTGEIKNTGNHIGSDDFVDVKEINFKVDEYLTDFHIRFANEREYVSQLRYSTNKKREILVGKEEGPEERILARDGVDNIIVGTFGFFSKKLDATGVLFIKKKDTIKLPLIGIFMARHLIKKEPKFKEENEKKFKDFDLSYQYLWRTLNLPDSSFLSIIKYCFILNHKNNKKYIIIC